MKANGVIALIIATTFCVSAFGKAVPITEEVVLKNQDFSQMIYEALEGKIKPVRQNMMAGSVAYLITVADGLSCMKTVTKKVKKFTCAILPDAGWRYMGMESYGSGENELLSKTLFEALDVEVREELDLQFKEIALDIPDAVGGTERNQFSCTNPLKAAIDLGFRPACSLLNAL